MAIPSSSGDNAPVSPLSDLAEAHDVEDERLVHALELAIGRVVTEVRLESQIRRRWVVLAAVLLGLLLAGLVSLQVQIALDNDQPAVVRESALYVAGALGLHL